MMIPGGAAGSGALAGAMMRFVRFMSRERCQDVRRINPKVPREEATAISKELYQIVKDRGPLTVSNTWNHAKEAGISGLNSKTHMKLMLKWMRGRKMLKLFCTHVGSSKKFLHSTLPEEPQAVQEENMASSPQTQKPPVRRKPLMKKKKKKQSK